MAGHHVIHTLDHQSLTLASGADLRSELVKVLEAAREVLVLDFRRVQYIDSHCIGVLVLAARLARRTTRIALTGLQPAVERSFHVSQLQRILPIFADVDTALREMEAAPLLAPNA